MALVSFVNNESQDPSVDSLKVRRLHLKSAGITTLEANVFSSEAKLWFLDINNNFLETLDHRLFKNMTKLLHLNLTNNKLNYLQDARLFESQSRLFFCSGMGPLLFRTMYCTWWWKCLMLFQALEIASACVPTFTRSCKYDIKRKSLDCTNVNLGSLKISKMLDTPTNIQFLLLVNTGLKNLEGDSFSAVPNLLILNMSSNALEILDPNLFRGLTKLRRLDLSNNKLKSLFDYRIFVSQGNLWTLRLQKNHVRTVYSDVLAPLKSLRVLDLTENPFICNCHLRLTMMWCQDRKLRTNAKCLYPLKQKGSPWYVLNYLANCAEKDTNEVNEDDYIPVTEIFDPESVTKLGSEEAIIELINEEPIKELISEEPNIDLINGEPTIELNNEKPTTEISTKESTTEISTEKPTTTEWFSGLSVSMMLVYVFVGILAMCLIVFASLYCWRKFKDTGNFLHCECLL
ncbi:slit homolog 1 protein-like [Zootermopsis nevadensis]|uniref:slit homolog 1 protein-like n=1 Tax=Zootermopsis nevadensis TaxID=136037 RepID=UPI000B8EA933|nr:slit homolog 1 protein-like [Zootermopsis nevadensis]